MIYRNKIEKNNNLPENIQVCLNNYKEALNEYALNDYKMRLNENSKDSQGRYNIAFRNAIDARKNSYEKMRESVNAAFIFAQEVYNTTGDSNIINEISNEFHLIVSNSIYNGSDAYECDWGCFKSEYTIEDILRTHIDNQAKFANLTKKKEVDCDINKEEDVENIPLD